MKMDTDWLNAPLTSIAMCWKLVRQDGLALGFTTHDQDLRLEGLRYRSRPGMTPSAVIQSARLDADSMEVAGVLDDQSIRSFDLDVKRWANAHVCLMACDWTCSERKPVVLFAGTLGQVSRGMGASRGEYRIELRADAGAIDLRPEFEISPTCRAQLGDGRCGVDMTGRTRRYWAAWGSGDRISLTAPVSMPAHHAGGRVRIVDGPLAGLDYRVEWVDGNVLMLEGELRGPINGGTAVILREGCDKQFATCRDRFANAIAFDGEPHVPGIDALVRYVDP